jgi:dienelactone hydrolase
MLHETPVVFHSHGVPLVGRLFRNTASLAERQPALIVAGSWLTVKEQMATTYARRLADAGYTAFVFDFAGFGESQGDPRQAEMPARKIADIRAAAEFLQSLAFVDADRIGCVAICASAQYTLAALAQGAPIGSFASVAGWYHDPASLAPFYGGEPGVQRRLERAREALDRYVRTREVTLAPAYEAGNERAGMHFELAYYAEADRGAIPAWRNAMAEMTWFYWLSFDGLAAAGDVATPSLFVHADGCVFPDHVRELHARLKGPKALVWASGSQIDFYDQPAQVDTAVEAAIGWFGQTLR